MPHAPTVQPPGYHHLLHFGDLHVHGWITFILSAALVAALVVAPFGVESLTLLGDPNLAG